MRDHYKGKMVPEGMAWNLDLTFDHKENAGVKKALISYAMEAADNLGYEWTTEIIEQKLETVYKNEKHKASQTDEWKEQERKKSRKNSARNKVS